MNSPKHPNADDATHWRTEVLTKFSQVEFQTMERDDLLLAQGIAGHGELWGIWQTDSTISAQTRSSYRRIDLSNRIRDFLTKEAVKIDDAVLNLLVEEGILQLTRLALLMRLTPSCGRRLTKSQHMKPSTTAAFLYGQWPRIIARAIRRKANNPEAEGLISFLTENDIQELREIDETRIELDRLSTFAASGIWSDLPRQADITQTTNPRGDKQEKIDKPFPGEYKPLPDEYLSAFGPRVLWVVQEMGPHLLKILEDLAKHLEEMNWSKITRDLIKKQIRHFIDSHLSAHPWKNRIGNDLSPPFPLITSKKKSNKNEWPPRTYEQLKCLSATFQAANLFLTLLGCAGRIGEVMNLRRTCVHSARDGNDYLRGWTYKLSGNLFGDKRQWPMPPIMVQCIGQQARLASVWVRLPPGKLEYGLPTNPPNHESLWQSLGIGGSSHPENPLGAPRGALISLARRLDMNPRPGGTNIHPHRFRKTIGRLAGVALFNSPLVLKRLFGHRNIEMTLHYILSDQSIRTEAEAVLRELRILHCAETLEELHDSMIEGIQLPMNESPPQMLLVEAVQEYQVRLSKSGRVWSESSAYDLAYLMTANGQGWRFIQKGIVCTKVPGEVGMCRTTRSRGEPETSNCKTECSNRLILETKRRDIHEIAESYLDVAGQALNDEQYLVFYEAMQRLTEELDAFPDIKEKYFSDPKVQHFLNTVQEISQ